MNRLDCIATRQSRSRLRDALFAALVVLAGAISIASVGNAVRGSHVTVAHD